MCVGVHHTNAGDGVTPGTPCGRFPGLLLCQENGRIWEWRVTAGFRTLPGQEAWNKQGGSGGTAFAGWPGRKQKPGGFFLSPGCSRPGQTSAKDVPERGGDRSLEFTFPVSYLHFSLFTEICIYIFHPCRIAGKYIPQGNSPPGPGISVQDDGLPLQTQPVSTTQLSVHPSSLSRFPSSQPSVPVTTPSLQ